MNLIHLHLRSVFTAILRNVCIPKAAEMGHSCCSNCNSPSAKLQVVPLLLISVLPLSLGHTVVVEITEKMHHFYHSL